jgi:hypothetical protein
MRQWPHLILPTDRATHGNRQFKMDRTSVSNIAATPGRTMMVLLACNRRIDASI